MSLRNKIVHSKRITHIFILSLLLSIFCPLANAEESNFSEASISKDPIVVNGDKVEYFHEKKQVVGTGNISIEFKDVVLTCNTITVYLDTREAIAEGNVKVTQKGAYFTGEKINYNFDTKKGTVLKGYINAKPFYGRADQVDKLANKDQFNLERGYITTCDLEKPHYRLQARQVRIYLNDKIVAKHIAVYIGNAPVLYWPYYVQPLKQRKSYITVMAGKKSEWGYYALTSLRYHVSDKLKGDLMLDYRTKDGMGFATGANNYYDLGEVGKGTFKFYIAEENDKNEAHLGQIEKRYRYQARHYWDMGHDTDTIMTMEFNKLSDPNVIKDYFYNEYTELSNNPDNYVSFITTKSNYTSELLLRKQVNKFQSVVERLPEYDIKVNNTRLFKDVPLYYTGSASGVYLVQRNAANGTEQKGPAVGRFDVNNQISYSTNFFRTLNMTPYVGTEDTYFSRTLGGETNRVRTTLNAGVNSSVKFYKVYDVESNFLNLDIHKLRHIITPTANYAYTHQPAIGPEKLRQYDSIDAVDKQNHVALGLENRLQTKRLSGGEMKSVDLATLLISSDYAFRLKKYQGTIYKQRFQNLDLQLELIPYDWLYSVCKLSYNTKNSAVRTASIDLVGSHGKDWSVSARYEYQKEETGIANLITADILWKLTEKWSVRAYERFSFFKKTFLEQEYTIYRDLHCFIAELTLDIQPQNSEVGLWFAIRMKAFPETPIGLKRTYSRPEFGPAVSRSSIVD